ncbi:hypothetical protein BWK59_14335 [Flavobacterium davisii]|uniref:Uncharacterized protein n=1 Tax=Flavobacterium davisii TaxID=2906077 RepID=A0A246GF33_9FLAO|nr:hypothetical protein [Flavobacterium davisii]OWP82722.1 hypothetical protein BWK59_14335 [Flavobacterium davisii]
MISILLKSNIPFIVVRYKVVLKFISDIAHYDYELFILKKDKKQVEELTQRKTVTEFVDEIERHRLPDQRLCWIPLQKGDIKALKKNLNHFHKKDFDTDGLILEPKPQPSLKTKLNATRKNKNKTQ